MTHFLDICLSFVFRIVPKTNNALQKEKEADFIYVSPSCCFLSLSFYFLCAELENNDTGFFIYIKLF